MKRRALISVTDKTGAVEFARELMRLGFSVLSTGGTFRRLQEAGVPAVEVSAYTGFPEMMDGRVKTLHPKVHGGILARRDQHEDLEAMEVHGIDSIDLVAVNLYRFREAASRPDASRVEIVDNIDIGGPALIRSAAKNHAAVTVVVDPADYPLVAAELAAHSGRVSQGTARRLAGKAFAHTARYDTAIANWFEAERIAADPGGPRFGKCWGSCGELVAELRYGENPHQAAALFADPDIAGPTLARAEQQGGKELSYNNLLDLDAALGVVAEFDAPAVAIVKHNNPCGAATADTTAAAFVAALEADPQSAYGGIVATNRRLDRETAAVMVARGTFVEAIVAPSLEEGALEELAKAKWGGNVRVLSLGGVAKRAPRRAVRMVDGGFLVQDVDRPGLAEPASDVVTERRPDDEQFDVLAFAWRVCKHVRSNAIVLAHRRDDGAIATCGVGAGQMSRVDAVEIAVRKAGERARGAVVASDAFFPFADGLQLALDAGVVAAIQPGGSRRDAEVVAAANAAGAAMVFTGARHFRH